MEQIREIAKKNEELNDLKLRFFTNISHELRSEERRVGKEC